MLTHSYTTKTANTIAATPANLAAGAPKAPTAALALADPETAAAAVNEALEGATGVLLAPPPSFSTPAVTTRSL